MTCATIEHDLIAYHFGAAAAAARAAVEDHLVACPACVRAFVALKRAIETAEAGPRPSDAARARLRRAVAAELGTGAGVRRAWWERPLAIAVAASLVLVAGVTTHAVATTPGGPPLAVAAGAR
jgi:anti-sigma factor RsiW